MKDFISLFLVAVLGLSSLAHAQKRVATGTVPPAAFADPNRKQKLATAFPEIEKLFNTFAERMPGAVMGIVVDGELVWVKAAGIREAANKAPVTPETVFRIASMTKSFTAASILKLRDD
ncbi:MAG TPA: serine hydrolase domain-containing protein, partial [Pyrinomonadaceae bacterium]|nr:serine hydrolase domain-containing protein [Pyrinomonadaceae bacterium]